ncbi:hypothetical protein KC622_02270 [Candidatus Dojkabacteria bacterium]|uniref:Aspartate/glutamate/uridylate kinase domain-containing protein n=1 Tax=Candidatus Dojkabacteria bacterium TaxID=2099670 RepID=A0A955I5Z1_9BACT|nr:hypothetical protein [Candidatus Dojkabacteria bacterium]
MGQSIVVKIGGSLLYNTDLTVRTDFLHKLVHWYKDAQKKYSKIVLATGGGKISRHLMKQVSQFSDNQEDFHQIGMSVTQTNAYILKTVLADQNIKTPSSMGETLEILMEDSPMTIISGGFKVGWSSDMNAAIIADVLHLDRFYKLSNIEYVYTSDPKLDPTAKPLRDMTWTQYFGQFKIKPGMTQHEPGMNVPIGAYCAVFCSEKGLSIFLAGGEKLNQTDISAVLESGSYIHP